MQVLEDKKKLLLALRDPGKVTALIPRSRSLDYNGTNIVAIEHALDEVRVLRNIGIKAPSPVLHYYTWSGQYEPFAHQRDTVEFLTLNPRAFCLLDMGTGKTLSALWAFDYLKTIARVNRMLVVSPLSTLERTWGDEIFRNFPHLSYVVLHGTATQRLAKLKLERDIYVINHDGLQAGGLLEALTKRDDIDIVVIDELASFRNSQTARWKKLNLLVNGKAGQAPAKPWVWGLTGTPTPNGPTDAWAQTKLVKPENAPKYFGAFKDTVMRQISPFKWVPRDGALQVVHRLMQPAIRFSRDECVDLPPTTYIDRHAELSPEQAGAYKQMLSKFKIDIHGTQVTAMNEAVQVNKLLQIVSGFVYSDDGDVQIPAPNRVVVVREVIEEAAGKVIVFLPFTSALMSLAEQLREDYSVEVVHGGTTKATRDRIYGDFQHSKDPQVLVANARTMSHGLTLTAADTVVWFCPTHSPETYEQANARVTRPGQKRNTRIVRIEGSPLERKMYYNLANKLTMQGTLLGLFD